MAIKKDFTLYQTILSVFTNSEKKKKKHLKTLLEKEKTQGNMIKPLCSPFPTMFSIIFATMDFVLEML